MTELGFPDIERRVRALDPTLLPGWHIAPSWGEHGEKICRDLAGRNPQPTADPFQRADSALHYSHTGWTCWPGPSGIVVVDCDRHDPAIDGVMAYRSWLGQPDGARLVGRSWRNGEHRYFSLPGHLLGAAFDSNVLEAELPPGVELKLAPHHTVTFASVGRCLYGDSSLNVPPQRLVRLLERARTTGRSPAARERVTTLHGGSLSGAQRFLRGAVSRIEAAKGGSLNVRLSQVAGATFRAVSDRLDERTIADVLIQAAVDAGEPLPSAKSTVASAARWARREN